MNFAQRLNASLAAKNLSIEDAARKTNIPQETLQSWLDEKTIASVNDAQELIFKLDLNPADLFELAEPAEEPPIKQENVPYNNRFFCTANSSLRRKPDYIKYLNGHTKYNGQPNEFGPNPFAHEVKLYMLSIPDELMDRAYQLVYGALNCPDWMHEFQRINKDLEEDTGWRMQFAGRNNGWLVLTTDDPSRTEQLRYDGTMPAAHLKRATAIVHMFDLACGELRNTFLKILSEYKIIRTEQVLIQPLDIMTK